MGGISTAVLWLWMCRFERDGDGRRVGGTARREGEDLVTVDPGAPTREVVLERVLGV
jgi:hypothetical protein